jgi:CheY-like chemotaxis protein
MDKRFSPPRILLVEDNPVFQTLILKQLEDISHDVIIYSKGESFLEIEDITADLVILDYHLAGDINGYDVLSRLKKLPFPPPVIFFSANLELTITTSVLKLGVAEYIEKSIFSLARLKEAIHHVLGLYPAQEVV